MSTTDASNIYRETSDASGFVMAAEPMPETVRLIDENGILKFPADQHGTEYIRADLCVLASTLTKERDEALKLAGVQCTKLRETVENLRDTQTRAEAAEAARKADWEILKGSPQEAMARLETVVHAAQVALKAIHTGRSEPLFIARDCLRNALEDIGASTDTGGVNGR